MALATATDRPQDSGPYKSGMVLNVNLPEGTDPAVVESIRPQIERAVQLLLLSEQPRMLVRADQIAELLIGKIEPNIGLVQERIQRLKTTKRILEEAEWLTAEQLNAMQPNPPAQKSYPASDWKRRGRIFSVSYKGRELFANYQFDEAYQPLPIIRDILKALGGISDNWKIAAWFNSPNGWISKPGTAGKEPMAPKDALDQRNAVLSAASNRHGSYVA